MKKRFLVLAFLQIAVLGSAQSYSFERVSIIEYEEYESYGAMDGENKHGRWVDSTRTGSLYVESYYEYGVPNGVWTFYYPDGDIRKQIEYEDGNIISWKSYLRDHNKGIELVPDSILDINTMVAVTLVEESIYELETTYWKEIRGRALMYYNGDDKHKVFVEKYGELLEALRANRFDGKVTLTNHDNKATSHIAKGVLHSKYYYVKDKLKRSNRYEDRELVEVTKYNSKGEIKSVKSVAKN